MRGVGRMRPAEEAKRKDQDKGVREKENMKTKEDLQAKENSRTRGRSPRRIYPTRLRKKKSLQKQTERTE